MPPTETSGSTKIGVLLAQLGTPEAPTAKALRPYLREFLSDPRVIDLSRWKNGGKSEEDIADLAKLLQDSIAGLLPPERRPSADTPALAPSGGNTFDT